MQQTGDTAISKRSFRRPRYECSKCSSKHPAADVPEGWLIVWDTKNGRFTHYCLECQDGKRGRKK